MFSWFHNCTARLTKGNILRSINQTNDVTFRLRFELISILQAIDNQIILWLHRRHCKRVYIKCHIMNYLKIVFNWIRRGNDFAIFRYVPIYIIPISIWCTGIYLKVQTTCSVKEQLRRIFKIKTRFHLSNSNANQDLRTISVSRYETTFFVLISVLQQYWWLLCITQIYIFITRRM